MDSKMIMNKPSASYFFFRGLTMIVSIYLLFFNSSCIFEKTPPDFNIRDRHKVSLISVMDKDTVILTRDGNHWSMNYDIPPDPRIVDNFLYAFSNIEIAGLSVSVPLDSLHARRILIREGFKKKIFRIYTSDNASWIHYEGSSKLYRIRIRTDKEVRMDELIYDDPADWSNRLIIDYRAEDLDGIRVRTNEGEQYHLFRDSTGFVCNVTGDKEDCSYIPDQEKALLYTSYFEKIFFTEVLKSDTLRKRIENSCSFYNFQLESGEGDTLVFDVYPLYETNGKEDLFYGALIVQGDSRIMRINYAYLDVLFQNPNYFLSE